MLEELTTQAFWVGLLKIIGVNIVLSGDNAVVIALAARSLPAKQQKAAVLWGSGAAVLRRALMPKPIPVPIRPARSRPYPRWIVIVSAACPGASHTGIRIVLEPCFTSTTSPLMRFRRSAVPGESNAPLSQVSFVSHFGSSCSHPLLANRPS